MTNPFAQLYHNPFAITDRSDRFYSVQRTESDISSTFHHSHLLTCFGWSESRAKRMWGISMFPNSWFCFHFSFALSFLSRQGTIVMRVPMSPIETTSISRSIPNQIQKSIVDDRLHWKVYQHISDGRR
jgi:hypothetical protein